LLDFRKIEQGGSPTIHKAKHNLGKLLDDVSLRFRPLIEQEGKRFEYKFDEQNFETCFDYEALTKVLSNLLSNAVKYTKDYILLSAKVDRDKEIIEILVQDNGCGIDPDEQEQVFAPFYQAKDPMPGTGIGLSIVKSMVEAHNGTIRLESEPGRGCSFYIELPFCDWTKKLPRQSQLQLFFLRTLCLKAPGKIMSRMLPPFCWSKTTAKCCISSANAFLKITGC
jgi:signal transduction histidine kinase